MHVILLLHYLNVTDFRPFMPYHSCYLLVTVVARGVGLCRGPAMVVPSLQWPRRSGLQYWTLCPRIDEEPDLPRLQPSVTCRLLTGLSISIKNNASIYTRTNLKKLITSKVCHILYIVYRPFKFGK